MSGISNDSDKNWMRSKSLGEGLEKRVFETQLRHFSLQCLRLNTKVNPDFFVVDDH